MCMGLEVIDHLSIHISDFVKRLWRNTVLKPYTGHSHDALGLELVAVGEITTKGFRVIGLVCDICQDEHPRLRCERDEGGLGS